MRLKRRILQALLSGMLASAPGVVSPSLLIAVPPDAQGLHDLVVIPPEAHERMLPAVELSGFDGITELAQVEIPETLHIHRYYYSGDKEIQGPILQGGPTMVVANHPYCGERVYLKTVLPSGAPKIAYTGNSITYVYPNQRVVIRFKRLGKAKVSVNYLSGQGIVRTGQQATAKFRQITTESLHQSAVAQSVHESAAGVGQFAHGAGVAVGGVLAGVIDGGRALVDVVPGVVPLKSLADQKAERKRDAEIRHNQLELDRDEVPFVPTNRN